MQTNQENHPKPRKTIGCPRHPTTYRFPPLHLNSLKHGSQGLRVYGFTGLRVYRVPHKPGFTGLRVSSGTSVNP